MPVHEWRPEHLDGRDVILTASAFLGFYAVMVTEVLSRFHALTRTWSGVCWILASAGLVALLRRLRPFEGLEPLRSVLHRAWSHAGLLERAVAAGCACILLVTLLLAVGTPPNAPDALSYHLSRVERWVQDGTLEPYPVHDERQIWVGPGAEFFVLHLRLLTGSGRLSNLVQWLAFAGSAGLVTLVARELGGRRRGQLLAAVFVLTMPMAIVQASGSQVDLVSSFYLCASVALMLRVRRAGVRRTSLATVAALGAAAGMAVLTKGTNAMFLMPFVMWTGFAATRRAGPRALWMAGAAVAIAVALVLPHSLRNLEVYGRPLGPAGSDELLNEVRTPAVLASNVMRNLAIHASSRFPAVNGLVYDGVAAAHRALGVDLDDARTTRKNVFAVPLRRENEIYSPNPLQVLLIVVAIVVAVARANRLPATHLACVVAGFLLFAFFLKWQPWHSRQHLPLLVTAAGAVGAALEAAGARVTTLVAGLMVILAGPAVFRNTSRPVIGRNPVFTGTREFHMFRSFPTHGEYVRAVRAVAASGCTRIGLLNSKGAQEYPLWVMLRDRVTSPLELRHVGVLNATRSAATARERRFQPCAIVSIIRAPEKPFSPPAGFKTVIRGSTVSLFLPQP